VLPAGQIELLKALQKTGKPIVALVTSGRPLILTPLQPLAGAIVQCWILGTETGNAIADVLTGAYNPSGKTVVTFPYAVGQIPIYYNHFNTGRPDPTDGAGNWYSRYRDVPNDPLYPFGYGLSYTTFSYGNLTLDKTAINKGGSLNVSVIVTNSGKYGGEEVVQLYIRDMVGSIVRPVKELKAFQKIKLEAGEVRKVQFTLTGKELSFYNAEGNMVLEPGKFTVFVGGNSKDVLAADFELR
jgi:beta-glucosidase